MTETGNEAYYATFAAVEESLDDTEQLCLAISILARHSQSGDRTYEGWSEKHCGSGRVLTWHGW